MLEKLQRAGFKPLHLNSHQTQSMVQRGRGEKTPQDCWIVMTRAEKILLFLLVLTLVVLITLSAFIIKHFVNEKKNCDTSQCIEESYKLLKTIDFDTNPCTDFHQYVCGNYIPNDKEEKTDLVTEDFNEDDSSALQTIKQFYQACINETAIEEEFATTLSDLLQKMGGWPLFVGPKWNEENFHWLKFMGDVRRYGVKTNWFLSFDYYEGNGTNLLLIKPPVTPPMIKETYYEDIISQLATMLGISIPTEGQLNEMINFGQSLNSLRSIAGTHRSDFRETVSQLNDIWSQDYLLSEIFNNMSKGYFTFVNSTTVVLSSDDYFYKLHVLLSNTKKRTQANYLVWKIIETYLSYSPNDIRDIYAPYVDLGTREEHCHAETVKRFYSVIEDESVGKYKSKETSQLLESIASLIYQSYDESEEVNTRIVVEEADGEESGVTNIRFSSNKIIEMINEVQFHIENEFFKCLGKEADFCVNEGYYEGTKEMQTYFDISDKTIYLPYSLVYNDSFMLDQPNYINFGKIGRIIANTIIEAEEEGYKLSINKVGVDLAYQGYGRWIQTKGIERRLPALNYTTQQLFWIYSSLTYCSWEDDVDNNFQEVEQSQYFKNDFECS